MPDDPVQPTPPPRPPRRAGRSKRFALPADHLEEIDSDRTSERIEAFLDGPSRARRTRRRHLRPEAIVRPRSVIPLDTRTDWERAVRHEDARVARYGRPASILLVDVSALPDGVEAADDRHIRRVGSAIRTQLRETDRLARVGPTRYHALLPETDEREAAALADRVSRACREVMPQPGGVEPQVRTAVAGPTGGGSLSDAVRLAQARLDA